MKQKEFIQKIAGKHCYMVGPGLYRYKGQTLSLDVIEQKVIEEKRKEIQDAWRQK